MLEKRIISFYPVSLDMQIYHYNDIISSQSIIITSLPLFIK